ncbi:hypothetical protein DFP72DRAFT_1042699 [Ephemerocybe angulata]|uniref:YCII-related domain-containing protein n=1 Tax=Ephemerocybe angulata TaxID=980116 RepID=A0A8H6I7N1_9AGAR|nr:hypothetical protein DFP72DRAFT_1042699 [Tulosesus angulatus]
MSSQAQPPRQLFFVYAPDKAEDGTFERRMSVRPKHLETAKERSAQGLVRLGGGLMTPESIESADAPKKLIGSTFIFQAASLEEVKKLVEEDIYYTSGVPPEVSTQWDAEKLVILPFAAATMP